MNENNSNQKIFFIFLTSCAVILLPFLLYHEFKENALENLPNLLSYFGSVIGAGATIIAVVWTINHNKKQIDEERILTVKPYLATELSQLREDVLPLEKQSWKIEYLVIDMLTYNNFSAAEFPAELKLGMIKYPLGKEVLIEGYIPMKYTLSNVGAGNAIKLKMFINESSIGPPFSLPVNKELIFVMLFTYAEKNKLADKNINIKFVFSDIYSKTTYEQIEKFELVPFGDTWGYIETDKLTPPSIQQ